MSPELQTLNASSVEALTIGRKIGTKSEEAASDGNHAQKQAKASTNTEIELDETFEAVANGVVFEEKLATLQHRPSVPWTPDQILVHDAITSIPIHVKKATTKLVLVTLTAQHKGVGSHLSAALEPLIEHNVSKLVRSTQTTAEIKEAVIVNPGSSQTTAALVKSEKQKCTDKRAKIKECCR